MNNKINEKVVKQISEAKYLAQENSYRYRPILRHFYYEYEKTKYWLYKEEVYEAIRSYIPSPEYTLAECERDLETLVGWESLTIMQDTSDAQTLKEFKNRRYRYQLTDYGVEIERLTIELENLEVKTSSLESKIFDRLKDKLEQLEAFRDMQETDLNELWHDLNNDFTTMNQNYKAFLKKFNEAKTEELLQGILFLNYKREFIRYLKNFIQSYQRNLPLIRKSLLKFSANDVEYLMNVLISHQKKIPNMRVNFDFDHLREVNYGKWNNIYHWFIRDHDVDSEGERLIRATSNIIVKVTKYASSLIELRGNMTSRKEEYKHICKLFDKQRTIQDAHCLSAVIFGIGEVKHFNGYSNLTTDSMVATYDIPPIEIPLEIRNHSKKEKVYALPIKDKSLQKEKLITKKKREQEQNKQILKGLLTDMTIDLKGEVHLTALERGYLLNLISKEGATQESEFGYHYQVVPYDDDSKCIIYSEDGTFEMNSMRIDFEGDKHE